MSRPCSVSAVWAMLMFTTPRVPFTVTASKITLPDESCSNSQTTWVQVLAGGSAQPTDEATHLLPTGSQTRQVLLPASLHCVLKLYRFVPSLWLTSNSMACAADGLST